MEDDSRIFAEMEFGRDDSPYKFFAGAFTDGEVVLGAADDKTTYGYALTIGQAIQLRDFLNRHIDELALKQVGSLAVRSSDDPTQLASVEEVQAKPGCGKFLYGHPLNGVFCGGTHGMLCVSCGGTRQPWQK